MSHDFSVNKMAEGEVTKLQNHLRLLREEYVKLQNKLVDVERQYQQVAASTGQSGEESFVARLLKIVAELYNKDTYSDLQILLEGGQRISAHKFVLAARSDNWGVASLVDVSQLDMTDINTEVSEAMLEWVYTDSIDIRNDDTFLLNLLKVSTRFKLTDLRKRCENALLSFVNVKNCIRYYQTADEMEASVLKSHCSELITDHWNDFTSEDFACLPAPLLFKMFKSKSDHPLHTAIRAHREDVIFLYLIEYNAQLSVKLNEIDALGDLPLDLALHTKQKSIAQTLISHSVDVNRRDNTGRTLLHKAIKRGDQFSAEFLIENFADVNLTTFLDQETPLHMVSSFNPDVTAPEIIQGMRGTAQCLLSHNADINAQDCSGNTAVHCAIYSRNDSVFSILLMHGKPDLELQNVDGQTPLWMALQVAMEAVNDNTNGLLNQSSFAACLLKHGSSPDAVNSETGDSLLHMASRKGYETAAIFLATNGAKINVANNKGETALHIGSALGLAKLVKVLLERGGNPNSQTNPPGMAMLAFSAEGLPVSKQTPIHMAISNKHSDVVQQFLEHKVTVSQSADSFQILPNFNVKDSLDQTVLGLALWNNMSAIASQLISGGANVNETNADRLTLLHQAIENKDSESSLFLLGHRVDIHLKTPNGDNPLQLAIKHHLPVVVDTLCARGVNLNETNVAGNCPLWEALDCGQDDIALILVKHGCDVDMWAPGPGQCQQTLLHRAIDENIEDVACFLIKSGCDKDSSRKPGPNGEGEEEAMDGQRPLHLACSWGLEVIVQCMMEHGADVNAQDAEGKAPIHVAIINQHHVIISLLLAHPLLDLAIKDIQGCTPFAIAMTIKNNKAAQAILAREPTAAEHVDHKGRNFLHLAIQKSDIESVLFLIGVHADVTSRVQDVQQLSPLHLATMAGSEMIIRNLLLAGATINDVTMRKQTALHLAAHADHSVICSVLLNNSIDFDAIDDNLNNALHLAIQQGNLSSVRILLTESRINAEAVNAKGQTPMHCLGQYGKDNAASIFELFLESMPEYPIDRPDGDGSTALLLAYTKGNVNLCRAIVRAGAAMGTVNKQGVSIFNAPVATKQLLFKLLDMLSAEPPWCEGEACLECAVKFGIKTRKHHCRHCGRLLCSKCSTKDIPIVKFGLSKPVRVCDVCLDVLTVGASF